MLKDSTDAFANLIRRSCMDEVPTLAVEDVEFGDNSSALYDEVVAHRLGLAVHPWTFRNEWQFMALEFEQDPYRCF